NCMAVEVEESALLHYSGDGFDMLSRVRETGIEVYMDNLDGDISSLRLLTRCPLNAIRIDRSLINGTTDKEHHALLVKALISLGHRLGTKVIAEGVETEEQ